MRQIKLTQRTARMLRENLVGNNEGYDYLDLKKLDWFADKLATLQGSYGEKLAEIAREEKNLIRQGRKKQITDQQLAEKLSNMRLDVEDLHEEAEGVAVTWQLEEADWKLICDKIDNVTKWMGNDAVRHLVIQMVEAVKGAETIEIEPNNGKVKGGAKEKEPALSLVGEGDG